MKKKAQRLSVIAFTTEEIIYSRGIGEDEIRIMRPRSENETNC